jgi:hypothetical protein
VPPIAQLFEYFFVVIQNFQSLCDEANACGYGGHAPASYTVRQTPKGFATTTLSIGLAPEDPETCVHDVRKLRRCMCYGVFHDVGFPCPRTSMHLLAQSLQAAYLGIIHTFRNDFLNLGLFVHNRILLDLLNVVTMLIRGCSRCSQTMCCNECHIMDSHTCRIRFAYLVLRVHVWRKFGSAQVCSCLS